MTHSYQTLLETSRRINWRVEDIIGGERKMDFSRPFLPESFARVRELDFLTPDEQRTLNHIRAHNYLAMFELIERCILPFINAHTPSRTDQDPWRTPAMAQFAAEEAKHIALFETFRAEFAREFGVACGIIGPADEIGAAVRAHSALGLAIFVLAIEWATQRHYLESIRDDQSLDPQFKSLLKHHWLEESQHARLDGLVFQEMAAGATRSELDAAVEDFLAIGSLLDGGLRAQAGLDLAALETAIGRSLAEADRGRLLERQHQAMRWTFIGTALVNRGFLDMLGAVSPQGRARIEQVSPAFC